MKLLLDTHILLWTVGEPKRLSVRAAREIADRGNQLWLSPVSIWEISLLQRKGRIGLKGGLGPWVTQTIKQLQLTEAPLTMDVALEVDRMNLPHGDPADRFIAASAKVFGLTLVTADAALIKEAKIPILANR